MPLPCKPILLVACLLVGMALSSAETPTSTTTPPLSPQAQALLERLNEEQRAAFLKQYAQYTPDAHERLIQAWINHIDPYGMGLQTQAAKPAPAKAVPSVDLAAYRPISIEPEKDWTKTTTPFWRQEDRIQLFISEASINLDSPVDADGDCRATGMIVTSINGGKVSNRRVGLWAITRKDMPVYTGCWNKNSIPVGPHLRYDDLGRLALIRVYGGMTASADMLSATAKVPRVEEIKLNPATGAILRRATYEPGAEQQMQYDDNGVLLESSINSSLPKVGQIKDLKRYQSGSLVSHQRFINGSIGKPGSFEKLYDKSGNMTFCLPGKPNFNPGYDRGFKVPVFEGTLPQGVKQVISWKKSGEDEVGILEAYYTAPVGPNGTDVKHGAYRGWTNEGKETANGFYEKGEKSGRWVEIEFATIKGSITEIATSRGSYVSGKKEGAWMTTLGDDHPDAIALEKERLKKEQRPGVLQATATHTIARLYKDGNLVKEERGIADN